MKTKEFNPVDYLLYRFWYLLHKFTFWCKGGKYFHVTLDNTSSEPLWKAWRELFYFLIKPKTKGLSGKEYSDWEKFTGQEEENVRQDYKKRYELTDKEMWDLHMAFSPKKIKKGLSYYEVKYEIGRYQYKKSLPYNPDEIRFV